MSAAGTAKAVVRLVLVAAAVAALYLGITGGEMAETMFNSTLL